MTLKKETEQRVILSSAHLKFEKKLNAYAFFKVHDQLTSEDLVQNTFMKTWLYLMKEGKIEIMKAFLYHILNNLIVDEYRKRKTTSLDILLENGFEPSIDESDRLYNILDGKAAFPFIQQLPEKYKKVVYMRYAQLLSLKEISSTTGQSKNTTAVQIHRGLEKLKLLYESGVGKAFAKL